MSKKKPWHVLMVEQNEGIMIFYKGGRGMKSIAKQLTNREKELIYFALSRQIDDSVLSQKEFNEVDNLREFFHNGREE